jgi:hypothetical protein
MGDGGLLAIALVCRQYSKECTAYLLKMILLISPYLVNTASTEGMRFETLKNDLATYLPQNETFVTFLI